MDFQYWCEEINYMFIHYICMLYIYTHLHIHIRQTRKRSHRYSQQFCRHINYSIRITHTYNITDEEKGAQIFAAIHRNNLDIPEFKKFIVALNGVGTSTILIFCNPFFPVSLLYVTLCPLLYSVIIQIQDING